MSKKFNAKNKYEKTQTSGEGGDIRRMKFVVGTNIIRIVEDNFEDAWVHYFKNKEGNKKRTICHGKGKCPVCAKGEKANHRFYFNVIDRKVQKESGKTEIKIMEIGKMIYDQIRELALDEEYGDPTRYNLKITRKGEKKQTKYSVRASTKLYSLTDKEKEIVELSTEEGGVYDLSLSVQKHSKSEILEMLGEEVDSEEDDDDESEDEEDTEDTDSDEKDKGSDDDDDDEEDLDIDKELENLEEDEDEEDEEPKSKKKSKKKKIKKTKKVKDEDEDEDW